MIEEVSPRGFPLPGVRKISDLCPAHWGDVEIESERTCEAHFHFSRCLFSSFFTSETKDWKLKELKGCGKKLLLSAESVVGIEILGGKLEAGS
jgi:hypothetical protein